MCVCACEYRVSNTYRRIDMNAVNLVYTFGRSGIRAPEPWLATRVPGRATGSPYNDTIFRRPFGSRKEVPHIVTRS